ncbi:hypothetical protein [Streptomyces sp. NRRL F-2580]|uniref:hypothetical protein n=1 Tax=Streptomyces sp. NRRL F-2580 TaxID=1463841 RepID=UPI000AAA2EF4|nr:hypothetical protein [Streptomyces sp. NRRL F-2580]
MSPVRWFGVVLLVLAATAAAPPSAGGTALVAPSPNVPSTVCSTADEFVANGHLAEAATLFMPVAGKDPLPCAARGLEDIDKKRQEARDLVSKGQGLLRAGELTSSAAAFETALLKDEANTEALKGLTEATGSKRRPAERRWDRFYDDWLRPALKLIVPVVVTLLVLLSLGSLLSRWLVRVESVEWPSVVRQPLKYLGYLILVGAAVTLPVHAMVPFGPAPLVPRPAFWTLLVLFVIAILAVPLAVLISEAERTKDGWRNRCVARHWLRFDGTLRILIIIGLFVVVFLSSKDHEALARWRLLAAYGLLTAYGLVLTAAMLGQNLRLQVAVQTADGKTDAAATDYLLARLQTLGAETPARLRTHNSTSPTALSTVDSEALSALPAGRVIGALSSLYFALRPDLTWRARANIVDANRVAITLSRNGSHAASMIFSRLDLGLPEVDASTEGDRMRAQLLTGAAAFILVQLSEAHPYLQRGLYKARNWKSVALHVIAASDSLIDNHDQRTSLLARAVNEDPTYPLARLEYLWALQSATKIGEPAYRQFADALDNELQELNLEAGSPLLLRALYRGTAQRINLHAEDGYPAGDPNLLDAKRFAQEFVRQCEATAKGNPPQWAAYAEQVKPIADVLLRQIESLTEPRIIGPLRPADKTVVPRRAYENACLDSFLALRQGYDPENAIRQARFALPNDRDRDEAKQDPCLKLLRERDDFRALVAPARREERIRRLSRRGKR